jgi:hypothetical protein
VIWSIETQLDGSTLIVRIPMRFQRRGGRLRPGRTSPAPRTNEERIRWLMEQWIKPSD